MTKDLKSLSKEELKHFENMHDSLRDNFPKTCKPCGTFFSNEKDYNNCTRPRKGFIGEVSDNIGHLFFRDCKHCPQEKGWGTMALLLDPKTFGEDEKIMFMGYIAQRATKEAKTPTEILNKVRDLL